MVRNGVLQVVEEDPESGNQRTIRVLGRGESFGELALVEGRSGVISSGFTVADEDALAAAETELERCGHAVTRGDAAAARSRRVRSFIGFDDPFGNRLELVCQQETITRPVAFTRYAGITDAVTLSGGYGVHQNIPPDLIEDIRRIPCAFSGFQTAW